MASETVVLGQTGITTSPLALGCTRLGSVLTGLSTTRISGAPAARAVARNLPFDTASAYGQNDSGRLIGRAVRGCRGGVCIGAKAGERLTVAQAVAARFKTHCAGSQSTVLRYAGGSQSGAKPGYISALSRLFSNARSSHPSQARLGRHEPARGSSLPHTYGLHPAEEQAYGDHRVPPGAKLQCRREGLARRMLFEATICSAACVKRPAKWRR
jgi:hypothetical protein